MTTNNPGEQKPEQPKFISLEHVHRAAQIPPHTPVSDLENIMISARWNKSPEETKPGMSRLVSLIDIHSVRVKGDEEAAERMKSQLMLIIKLSEHFEMVKLHPEAVDASLPGIWIEVIPQPGPVLPASYAQQLWAKGKPVGEKSFERVCTAVFELDYLDDTARAMDLLEMRQLAFEIDGEGEHKLRMGLAMVAVRGDDAPFALFGISTDRNQSSRVVLNHARLREALVMVQDAKVDADYLTGLNVIEQGALTEALIALVQP